MKWNFILTTNRTTDLTPYAKTEDVNAELDNKANASDVYTRTEIDETVTKLNNDIANGGKLKSISVNGGSPVEPDDKGNANIIVQEPDLSEYAKTTDVDKELETKASADDLKDKADTTDVNTLKEQLTKALSELDTANQKIAELEKRKFFEHFKTAQEAKDWSAKNDGIGIVDDTTN